MTERIGHLALRRLRAVVSSRRALYVCVAVVVAANLWQHDTAMLASMAAGALVGGVLGWLRWR